MSRSFQAVTETLQALVSRISSVESLLNGPRAQAATQPSGDKSDVSGIKSQGLLNALPEEARRPVAEMAAALAEVRKLCFKGAFHRLLSYV